MSDNPAGLANRLSVSHLLLWTTTTATVVAMLQGVMPLQESASSPWRRMDWILSVVLLCGSPAWGAAIAGLALAVWRFLWHQPGFPAEPGHWLLVILGTLMVGAGLVTLSGTSAPGPDAFAPIVILALHAVVFAEIGCAAWHTKSRHWQVVFISIVIGWLLLFVAAVVSPHSRPAPSTVVIGILGICVALGLPPIAFVTAIVMDLVRSQRRDVLHWAGVATLAAIAAQPLAVFATGSILSRLR